MDSDSDPDGSHVSATPPRDPFPPPPRPPQPPPVSLKVASSSSSHSKPKAPNPSHKAPTQSSLPPPPSPLFTNLPFRICESKPVVFSSSVSSFARLRSRASLTTSDEKLKPDGADCVVEPPPVVVAVNAPPKPVRRKPPNLITDTITSPPVKPPVFRTTGNGEGNFVKLNLNGKRGKKFPSKYKGVSKSRSSYAFRGKRYKKKEADGQGESLLEEDSDLQKQVEDEANGFISSVEDAILAVKAEASDENLTKLLNLVYGYDSFRDGQLQGIKMVLGGSSTMLVLPTGAGKSLCYQVPAMILPGITLVVSPLVSLMIDQLKHLPSIIKGGLLSSSQRPEEATETLRKLKEGIIKVLFVSPERLLNVEFLSMFRMSLSVSLVVVDEAHCVSEWSHNFRPSYMRLKASMLFSELKAECILAMTATATTMTLQAVMSALEIPSTNLIQKSQLRDNFELSVSLSGANRMKDLLILMESHPYKEIRSIIVYCKFQVRKLDIMSSAAVAAINVSNTSELSFGAKQTLSLQSRILDYFNGDDKCDTPSKTTQNCAFLRADIKVFLQSNRQAKFTPRAIARIMHGVGSPAFPNSVWSKTHFWGRYMSVDFRVIMEAAQTELFNFVDRNAALAT